jgi:hypothetical protein
MTTLLAMAVLALWVDEVSVVVVRNRRRGSNMHLQFMPSCGYETILRREEDIDLPGG